MMSLAELELDRSLTTLQYRCDDLSMAVGTLLTTLEEDHETIQSPKFLTHYSIIISNFKRIARTTEQLGPYLRSHAVTPVRLSRDRDERLALMTHRRVPVLSHETAPDLLRTQTDPRVRRRHQVLNVRASVLAPEVGQVQYDSFVKKVTHIWSILAKGREELLGTMHAGHIDLPMTSRLSDTHALIAAIGNGAGLTPPKKTKSPSKRPRQKPTVTVDAVKALIRAPAIRTNVKPSGSRPSERKE